MIKDILHMLVNLFSSPAYTKKERDMYFNGNGGQHHDKLEKVRSQQLQTQQELVTRLESLRNSDIDPFEALIHSMISARNDREIRKGINIDND